MKRNIILVILISACIITACAYILSKEQGKKSEENQAVTDNTEPAKAPPKEMSSLEKKSYTIGLKIGMDVKNSFEQQKYTISPEFVVRGFNHAMKGVEPSISKEEIEKTDKQIRAEMAQNQKTMQEEEAMDHLKKGQEFLAANGKKDGVKTTQSGLQYEVIKEGDGKKPSASDTVRVHYEGTLIDGTVFDSSYKRGKPISFPLNGVIKGWTEGLQLMKVGSKFRFFIPSDLAYGARGAGNAIGPNCTLIFEVELLGIQ